MKFKDHILDYKPGAEEYDYGAAQSRIEYLCSLIVHFHCWSKIGDWACKEAARFIRKVVRESEQADRYKRKLWMLRTKAVREKVFQDLGGIKAMMRWYNQPPDSERMKREIKPLTQEEINYRIHFRFCAKQAVNPQILRDPCKLDEEGIFRLPPIRRRHNPSPKDPTRAPKEYDYDARPVYEIRGFSEPIMVWPDEFLVFGEWERDNEIAAVKDRERRIRVRTWCSAQALMADALCEAKRQEAIYAPP